MTPQEKARALRPMIEKAAVALTDEDAVEAVEMFPSWNGDFVQYDSGVRLRYGDKLYRVLQAHTSQPDWPPDATPALFAEVAKPGEIPVWKQPTGAQDAYMTGDKVYYPDENGSVYESEVDNNVWEPTVYGWKEV